MRTLLQFVIRHHFTLLFIVFEIIGLSMLSSFNSYHQARVIQFRNSVSGHLSARVARFGAYMSLEEDNTSLARENTELYNRLRSSYITHIDPTDVDTSRSRKYAYMNAKVINNSINRQFNYITINRGRADGIESDMGVISPNGLVGVVTAVSEHFATVISVLNREFFPNVKLKKNDFFGYLEWPGTDYRYCQVKDIPLHAIFEVGDTVVTSGFSAVFPEGVLVGVVTGSSIDKGINYSLDIKLSTDFKSLDQVTVIKNLLKQEQHQLELSQRHD